MTPDDPGRVLLPSWQWLDRPGLDAARIAPSVDGIDLRGYVVTTLDDRPIRLHYAVGLQPDWQVRTARLTLETHDGNRSTTLAHGPDGWTVDDAARPDLDACVDLDIMGTPSTNTLPIRRLDWHPGDRRDLSMAYIALPTLAVEPMAQRYARLDDAPEGRRFAYRSVGSGFHATLLVDDDGLVVDYPPYWRRLW